MNLNDVLFLNKISKIEQHEIVHNNMSLGWHSNIFNFDKVCIAGGTSSNKEDSLKISYAELIERTIFNKICSDKSLTKKFLVSDYPTTCGFAAGFDKRSTKNRAILEAFERWIWHKWIDEKCYIPEYNRNIDIPIFKYLVESKFDNYTFYLLKFEKIQFEINDDKFEFTDVYFGACLAFTNEGVFLGSRVSNDLNDVFKHSAVEVYRANIIFNNLILEKSIPHGFFQERVMYWGNNRKNIPEVSKFTHSFPKPEIEMLAQFEDSSDFFVFRSIMKDFKSWHLENEKRFIY